MGCRKGDAFGPETFALGTFRGNPARRVPWDAARETDSAMERREGDAFCSKTVALGESRANPARQVLWNAARETFPQAVLLHSKSD